MTSRAAAVNLLFQDCVIATRGKTPRAAGSWPAQHGLNAPSRSALAFSQSPKAEKDHGFSRGSFVAVQSKHARAFQTDPLI
jgi:hypothetical protein